MINTQVNPGSVPSGECSSDPAPIMFVALNEAIGEVNQEQDSRVDTIDNLVNLWNAPLGEYASDPVSFSSVAMDLEIINQNDLSSSQKNN